jgi:hypothetical protein
MPSRFNESTKWGDCSSGEVLIAPLKGLGLAPNDLNIKGELINNLKKELTPPSKRFNQCYLQIRPRQRDYYPWKSSPRSNIGNARALGKKGCYGKAVLNMALPDPLSLFRPD